MINKLKIKIIIPMMTVLVLFAVLTMVVVTITTGNLVYTLSNERIEGSSRAVIEHLESLKTLTRSAADSMATSPTLINYIQSGTPEEILAFLLMRRDALEVDNFVVTDADGLVVALTHEPYIGGGYADELLPCVAAAIRGGRATAYITTPYDAMAICSAVPIFDADDVLIGTISSYFIMSSDDFVRTFADIFNAQVTVFAGEYVAASTVRNLDGSPITGFPVESPHIAEHVIGGGESYRTLIDLYEVPHHAYYFPLHDAAGEVIGMFFIGFSNEYTLAATTRLQRMLVVLGVLSLVLSSVIVFFVLTKVLKPLKNITQMLDAAPIIVEFWDERLEAIDCNQATLDYYGYASKKDYLHHLRTSTRHKDFDDGTPYRPRWNENISRIFREGTGRFEFIDFDKNGAYAYHDVEGIHTQVNNKPAVITYSTDITPLKYREKLLGAMNRAAEVLLTTYKYDMLNALTEGMRIVGICLDADRVQIWRNEEIDGEMHFVMRYEWLSEVGKEKIEVPQGLSFPYTNVPDWLEMFMRGEAINAPVSELPPRDAEFLKHYEMLSVVCVPMFLNQELVGFFSVDDCRHEKTYTENEINMMASVGSMFVNVFNNIEQETLQRERERETNERIQRILDSAPLGVVVYDSNASVVDCNEELAKMFGFTNKDDATKEFSENFFDFFPEIQACGTPTVKKLIKLVEDTLAEGTVRVEWAHLNRNGETIPTDVIFTRISDSDDFMFVSYVRDLREERAAIQKETENRLFTESLYNASPIYIDIWDENLNLVECNDKICDLLGISDKEEYLADPARFEPAIQPCGTPSLELFAQKVKNTFAIGFLKYDWMMLDAKGEEVPVEVTATRIIRKGKPHIVGYNYDLRQRRLLEKQERERHEKAAIEAEERSRAKSSFLARMSHEIRTPLTAVMGISEVQLRSLSMPPHTEEAFSKIYDSSKVLLNIVNDILDFSKVESGKMSLLEQEYDVASLARDVSQLHLVYLENKDITFQMYVDKDLPLKLFGDSLRIRQVITNLLSNAFKYTESGSVSLSITRRKSDNPENIILTISVEDTGIGMSAEQIEEIRSSDEYTRLHEHEKPFVSGTGLGLPIVYNMVEMMKAELNLQSEVGKGTFAILTIPQKIVGEEVLGEELAEKLQSFEPGSWSIAQDLAFTPEQMPYGKVLVVDDVDTNLYVAEAMLSSFGVQIELCESGATALDKISRGKTYDIIFLDHMMPEMDGIEVAKKMREMGYDRPIVALTANAIKGQSDMFIANGFSGFMAKPIDIKLLNSYLVRFIKTPHEAE